MRIYQEFPQKVNRSSSQNTVFLFLIKNKNLCSFVILIKSFIFHEKVYFFHFFSKSDHFGENPKLTLILISQIKQIHGFWRISMAWICHQLVPFPFDYPQFTKTCHYYWLFAFDYPQLAQIWPSYFIVILILSLFFFHITIYIIETAIQEKSTI